MKFCYFFTVFLGIAGVVYNDFDVAALLTLFYISISSLPLLICSYALETAPIRLTESKKILGLLRGMFFLLSLLNLVIFVRGHGFGILDLMSSGGILNLAVQSTLERYQYGSTEGNPLLIAATFVNAFLWPTSRLSTFTSVILGLLPAGIYTVISTEKWPLYCAMSLFVTSKILIRSERETVGSDYIRVIAVAAVVGMVCFGSLILRWGISSVPAAFDAAGDVANLFANYLFAQYDTFGQWFANHFTECCTMGRYSFVGIISFLGIAEREQGVFSETVINHGLDTNIYTAWRYWAQDFSAVGPIVIFLTYALMYRYSIIRGHLRFASALLTLLFISTFLQISTTIFVHNSVTLASVVCALIVVSFQAAGTPKPDVSSDNK